MNKVYKIFGAAALSLGLAACGSSSSDPLVTPTPDPDLGNIAEVASENGNFDTLVTLLGNTGLDEVLSDPDGAFTVFAPTDDAFALLGEETLAALEEDPELLEQILLYHVYTEGVVDAGGAMGLAGSTIEMGNGDYAGLGLDDGNLYVNLSLITMPDVQASNGVIHVIDAVMMPPEPAGDTDLTIAEIATDNGNFETLLAAVDVAGLTGALDDPDAEFTLFAPTDDAFAKIDEETLQAILDDEDVLEALLMQHLVPDATVGSAGAYAAIGTSLEMGNGAELPITVSGDPGERVLRIGNIAVTMVDIYASNGVIHVVDTVIVGDLSLPAPMLSIVEVAEAAGNFETLLAALNATDLDEVLGDLDETFTVFAPTDDAFDALEEGLLDELLADTDRLRNILLYHVFGGERVDSGAAIGIAEGDDSIIEMVNDDYAALSLGSEGLLINLSNVIDPDVMAENGIIHAVDTVMMPPAERGEPTDNIVETAIANDDFNTLVDLVVEAGLDGALSNEEANFTVFAPTDAAFEALGDALDDVRNDPDLLEQILLGHVLDMEVNSILAYSLNGGAAETMATDFFVDIEIANGTLTVGGSTVVAADIYTTNGIIHVIDTVILPEAAPTNVTINNVGSSSWEITDIEGDGAEAELDTENAELTLEEGVRYTITNLGADNHPLQLRDADGEVLIAAAGNGSLQDDEDINVVVDEEAGTLTFTLTGALAENVATYNCAPHASMEGAITVM